MEGMAGPGLPGGSGALTLTGKQSWATWLRRIEKIKGMRHGSEFGLPFGVRRLVAALSSGPKYPSDRRNTNMRPCWAGTAGSKINLSKLRRTFNRSRAICPATPRWL